MKFVCPNCGEEPNMIITIITEQPSSFYWKFPTNISLSPKKSLNSAWVIRENVGWICPNCRQTRRLALRGERVLFKTDCQQCHKEIIVSYDPSNVQNAILCKEDYQKYYEEHDPMITDPLPQM